MARAKRVLVLITEKISQNDPNGEPFSRAIKEAFPSDGVDVTMGELLSLTYEISSAGDKIYDRARGFSLDDFDFVVFRFIRKEYARAGACVSFLNARGIPFIDSRVKSGNWSKYSATVNRYYAGLPPIPSVFAKSEELQNMVEHDQIPFEYPLIIKDVNGKKGSDNFIAYTKQEAQVILNENLNSFIVQKYIKNDGDYRLLVIGGKLKLAIYRQAIQGSHLNNTSKGATASVVDINTISDDIVNDAILSAALEELEIAGVDIMIDKETGQHYIIEVNPSPQLASGAVPELKMRAYASYIYERATHTLPSKK